jgi:uncharacterized repeat protein (TIGR03803 family)
MDSGGNLYGTTAALYVPPGGLAAYGTIFELAEGSGTITTLATFDGTDGTASNGALVMDGKGNLYGTSEGTAFELPKGTGTINTLVSFNGSNGTYPVGGLITDGGGNLYGVTTVGGAANDGTVFELSRNGVALLPQTLPAATVGAGYNQALTAVGGTAPYTFAVTAGSLPGGLTLSTAGVLSGTPTAAGPASFTVTATDTTGASGSQAYTLAAYPATFSVTGFPSPTTAGVAGPVTVTALDANGNVVPSYTGTVHFSSSDPQAVLPANYTFTAADQGVHTFSARLKTAGSQSLTATDTASSSTVGSDTSITVNPAAPAKLILSAPASVTRGSAFTLTLTVEDAYGNVASGYRGTVHFSSSDSTASLPANYTFTAADAGVHTFSAILRRKGKQTLTGTDTANSALTATDTISVG